MPQGQEQSTLGQAASTTHYTTSLQRHKQSEGTRGQKLSGREPKAAAGPSPAFFMSSNGSYYNKTRATYDSKPHDKTAVSGQTSEVNLQNKEQLFNYCSD